MVNVLQHPSPNFNARPGGVTAVVLHGTAGSSVEDDLAWLCDEATDADGNVHDTSLSYHYLIGRGGTIYQLVDEDDRAWHAGVSEWRGRPDLNDYSIGVGLTNRGPVDGDARKPGAEPYPDAQILAAAQLVADICRRRSIPWHRVLTHAQVSPGRKHDPWLHFPVGAFAGALLSYTQVGSAA